MKKNFRLVAPIFIFLCILLAIFNYALLHLDERTLFIYSSFVLLTIVILVLFFYYLWLTITDPSYKTLEQIVKDRTQDLVVRTRELEAESKRLLHRKAVDEAILESIGEALCVMDKEGRINYVNKAFEMITGWPSKEALGQVFTLLIPSETEAGVKVSTEQRYLSKILNGEDPESDYENTMYYIRRDGSRFAVSALAKRIMLDGQLIGAVKTFSDVTPIKNIDKAKSEFVSLSAHQLRTPLSSIGWYTEMLLSGDAGEISEDQRKYLTQIYEANQRMVRMVKSFLNVSRIEMGTMKNKKQETNIIELLNGVINEQRSKIEEKNINFSFVYMEGLPLLSLDAETMRMAFQNLLANAIKYTNENGKVFIEVSTNPETKQMVFKFSDTGLGIPKEDVDKIFTKLFRAKNALEKAMEGTGLGLYLVKNIVDKSGGKIWFESEENKGTTFFLTLPL